MRNHVSVAVITAALAGCAACAEPYAAAPYGMTDDAVAAPAPVRATRPVEPAVNDAKPDEAATPERKSKTQSQ